MTEQLNPIRAKVRDSIFNQEIHVFCNCTEADLKSWEKRMGASDDEGLNPNFAAFSTHYSKPDTPNIYLIWLNHFDWTLEDQNSLIHEIVHTITRIWEANNIRFTPETQEFFAHSVGNLYADIGAKLIVRKKTKEAKDKQ